MIYAKIEKNSLIVAAATTLSELEVFCASIKNKFSQASVMEMLSDERFAGFQQPPYIITFENIEEMDAFVSLHEITIVKKNALVDRQSSMLEELETDPYFDSDDERTIEEIHGLDKDDPWDRRSDEEKVQDEYYKKMGEEAKKRGELTGDSFGPAKKKKKTGVFITDVNAHTNDDGTVEIDKVIAVKGHYDKDIEPPAETETPDEDFEPDMVFHRVTDGGISNRDALLNALGFSSKVVKAESKYVTLALPERLVMRYAVLAKINGANVRIKTVDVNGKALETVKFSPAVAEYIDPDGSIAIYQRVDVKSNLVDIVDVLEIDSEGFGQNNDGSWFAFKTQTIAEQFRDQLIEEGFSDIEVYGVNDRGERLLPKGTNASLVDPNATREIGPRPWNGKSSKYFSASEEELKEIRKNIKGDELIYTGSYNRDTGTTVYITPKSVFVDNGERWKNFLDEHIRHLLPDDLKEIAPGIFRSKSRDYNHISYALAKRGITENLLLQLNINCTE